MTQKTKRCFTHYHSPITPRPQMTSQVPDLCLLDPETKFLMSRTKANPVYITTYRLMKCVDLLLSVNSLLLNYLLLGKEKMASPPKAQRTKPAKQNDSSIFSQSQYYAPPRRSRNYNDASFIFIDTSRSSTTTKTTSPQEQERYVSDHQHNAFFNLATLGGSSAPSSI